MLIIMIFLLILSAILFFGINSLLIFTRVKGNSMNPGIENNEIIIGCRDSKYRRGDVIVLSLTDYNRKKLFVKRKNTYIKRVIALPGDTIDIKNGKVYINNVKLQEYYLFKDKTVASGAFPVTIPAGHVFVMGDNRSCSIDSRNPSFGLVKEKNIIATCFAKFGTNSGAVK